MTEILSYISKITSAEIGQLPEKGGLAMQLAPASAPDVYLDGSSSDNMSLLFLCKNKDQPTALSTLENVCNTLTRIKKHPHDIYNLHVATTPNYVGKDGDYWIYSCIINLKYYNKEEF